ncbi:NAD(P)-binding protein, partial [Ralstonia pseudosolanacearum]|uniref:NAD(P)-binding protein n=1 Tax=Ralstonia pseudosolanacearum TaxID=1310165 RepID=UPI003CF76029
MTQPSIAIVGAGIAGVACANALAAEGISATVYERGGGVGGRLATRVLPEGAPTHAFALALRIVGSVQVGHAAVELIGD